MVKGDVYQGANGMKHGKWNTRHCPEPIRYFSKRYMKLVLVPKGYSSDGATGAPDINSRAWWVHDKLCDTGTFEGGSKCNNWQASQVLQDILSEEGRWFRAKSWFWGTWFFGGGRARKNGMC